MREPRHSVDIRVDETTASLFTAGRVTNISRGGLFIESRPPLPIQSVVDLALHLPEIDTVLNVRGRVVWSYDVKKTTSQLMTGSGIKFVGLSPAQLCVLESYIASLGATAERPRYAATGS